MLIACLLIAISIIAGNILIFQLDYLFLLFVGGIINYYSLIKRINFIQKLTDSSDPYIHELRIRYYLFNINKELSEENKEYIFNHFKVANAKFFTFSLQYI